MAGGCPESKELPMSEADEKSIKAEIDMIAGNIDEILKKIDAACPAESAGDASEETGPQDD